MQRSILSLCRRHILRGTRPFSVIAPSNRVKDFGASVFSEFTPLANKHGAVNLGQGFPDWETPGFVKEAASIAVGKNQNQYTRSQGHIPLVNTLKSFYSPLFKRDIDAMGEIVVTAGATEAYFATCQALLNQGDEVILMEPFYDMYPAAVHMAGGVCKYVPLRPKPGTNNANDWVLDFDELEGQITPRSKAIVLNTPHNPLGKVFSRTEMEQLAAFVVKHNLFIITDECYEFITMDQQEHIRMASLPGMWDRTVTLCSAGKTFSITGWKIGWTFAPAHVSKAIAMAHQWITFCVATPLQEAVSLSFKLASQNGYFDQLKTDFELKRNFLMKALADSGLEPTLPSGGYFIMANTSSVPMKPPALREPGQLARWDYDMCRHLTAEVGVAAIPASAFYSEGHANMSKDFARFCYCKRNDVLEDAAQRLLTLHSAVSAQR